MNCPMAVLTEEPKHQMKASFPLLLSFLQSPFGSHPNEIENRLRQQNLKKYVYLNLLYIKFCSNK